VLIQLLLLVLVLLLLLQMQHMWLPAGLMRPGSS
jgi:hypothetical protein